MAHEQREVDRYGHCDTEPGSVIRVLRLHTITYRYRDGFEDVEHAASIVRMKVKRAETFTHSTRSGTTLLQSIWCVDDDDDGEEADGGEQEELLVSGIQGEEIVDDLHEYDFVYSDSGIGYNDAEYWEPEYDGGTGQNGGRIDVNDVAPLPAMMDPGTDTGTQGLSRGRPLWLRALRADASGTQGRQRVARRTRADEEVIESAVSDPDIAAYVLHTTGGIKTRNRWHRARNA